MHGGSMWQKFSLLVMLSSYRFTSIHELFNASERKHRRLWNRAYSLLAGTAACIKVLGLCSFTEPIFAERIHWGNSEYINIGVGETIESRNHKILLRSIHNNTCDLEVDGIPIVLTVARLRLPVIVNGLRLFAADNRPVADLTTDKDFPRTHAALEKDLLLCVSDGSKPLLNKVDFVFPVSCEDGFKWRMNENSHMHAYLRPSRSHQGIDINMHEARGRDIHHLVAIEKCRVALIVHGNRNEACVIMQSQMQPTIFYVYQHLYRDRLLVREGECVTRGQPLGTIWGDPRWGHFHFAVVLANDIPTYEARYQKVLNCFPQLYELYYGDLQLHNEAQTSGDFRFAGQYFKNGNRQCLDAYSEVLGYGWRLGNWCTSDRVETSRMDEGLSPDQSAVIRPVMHSDTPYPAANPKSFVEFESQVLPGRYRVRALVGDAYQATWQRVAFEGINVSAESLPAGSVQWTPESKVTVTDGLLTMRLTLKGDETPAAVRELNFIKDQ